jgi:multimeric flavodoxin WrbA
MRRVCLKTALNQQETVEHGKPRKRIEPEVSVLKTTVLDGSKKGDSAAQSLHDLVVQEMTAKGWPVQSLPLAKMHLVHCTGCFGCWVKTPGRCVIKDDADEVARHFIQSELVVFFTRVTFGGYSSELKKALDRMICLVSPFFKHIGGETHHRARYEHYPMLLGIGLTAGKDPESAQIFQRLLVRNAINMHAPRSAAVFLELDRDLAANRRRLQPLLQDIEIP